MSFLPSRAAAKSVQILNQTLKERKQNEAVLFFSPAMTAFVEATAGMIRFTTPEKITFIKI